MAIDITLGFQGKARTESKFAGLIHVQMVPKAVRLVEISKEVSVDRGKRPRTGHSNINIKV